VKRNILPLQYLSYLSKAKGLHGTHSAFVYELYEKVINGDKNYYDFAPIEHLRKKLQYSQDIIEVVDFGAGAGGKKKRTIADITKKTSVSPKKGRTLFRLVNFIQPKVMVEMGTSLGISTLYQAKACPSATMITLEGSPETATVAGKNFGLLKALNIKQVVGDFNETLPALLKEMPSVDYVFFDGNHRKEATLNYFKQCLPLVTDGAAFVFDDIRWSQGMFEAWNEIIKEPLATVTIDFFTFGVAIFRKGQVKEHFTLKC